MKTPPPFPGSAVRAWLQLRVPSHVSPCASRYAWPCVPLHAPSRTAWWAVSLVALLVALLVLLAPTAVLAESGDCAETPPAPDPWRYEGVEKVVAVADVHGAYDAFVEILEHADVIDDQGRWAYGKGHLVLLGDLVDRGARSIDVLDFVMDLQAQAAEAGGRVHQLLGNHEVMVLVGDLRYVHPNDFAAFAGEEHARDRKSALRRLMRRLVARGEMRDRVRSEFEARYPPGYFAFHQAFSKGGRYACWLLRQRAFVVINGTVFIHGGLGPALQDVPPGEINERALGEIAEILTIEERLEGAGVIAPEDDFVRKVEALRELHRDPTVLGEELTPRNLMLLNSARSLLRLYDESLLMRSDGPAWYRGQVLSGAKQERASLEAALSRLGAKQVVVGHTPSHTGRVASHHGGRVIQLDTGMLASHYKGRPSALRLAKGEAPSVLYAGEEAWPLPRPLELPGELVDYDAMEAFLRKAKVIAREEVGAGSTEPEQLTLKLDGIQRRAIFKTHAETEPVRDPYGVADRYQHEVAAYRLARLLGLDLVPPTVLRTIDGVEGSLQLWIEDAISEQARRLEELEPADPAAFLVQLERARVFDALIHNHQRSPDNMLVTTDDWRVYLIDHARSFGPRCSRPDRESVELSRDPSLAERIARLHPKKLESALGDVLTREEIHALAARGKELLANGLGGHESP